MSIGGGGGGLCYEQDRCTGEWSAPLSIETLTQVYYSLIYPYLCMQPFKFSVSKIWEQIRLNIKNLGHSYFKNEYKKILLKSQV